MKVTDPASDPHRAWWRFGMVWLVLAGPAAVVVASSATFWLAWRHADPVMPQPHALAAEQEPALKARNHAATPRHQP